MLTITRHELPQTKCPVKRGKAIITRAKQHGIELPLIITPMSCGGVRVRGGEEMKRSPNPFDSLPSARPDAIITIIALLFVGYGLWILWPVFEFCWMLFTA